MALNSPRRMILSFLAAVVIAGLPLRSALSQFNGKSTAKPKAAPSKPATTQPSKSRSGTTPSNPFPKRISSPGLDGGKEWLNTSGEITLRDLRGKVVLLDFWTYCCINCMHILPDLSYLEQRYPDELVVIGVHSGKFSAEKDDANIRNAILRYEIEHPVVNDASMAIWTRFKVNTWPTFVLIDPEGYLCGALAGEGNRDNLDQAIARVIDYHRAKGTLDETPLHFDLESRRVADTPLRFPGKVIADEDGDRLFIADSNHSRIVVTDLAGKLLYTIGSGVAGNKDGDIENAQFDHPQGMDLDGNLLYVADTENHLIREVDLVQRTVKAIAGIGLKARVFYDGGEPLRSALSSPWDVKRINGRLYIAMAGFHQIWVLNGVESVRPYAGTGREDITNGQLNRAALAQPSGLATDDEYLYVVDSEGSAVRKIGLDTSAQVTTLVGTSDLPQGRCLFEFGDRDGIGNQARLQHPLGIAYRDGKLYVADSYNHKIKEIDIAKRSSVTFLPKEPIEKDRAERPLFEPAGVSIADDKLFIADTNNHRIRVYDFETKELTTLEIAGLESPRPATSEAPSPAPEKTATLPVQTVETGMLLRFNIDLGIPEGFKLNPEAPVVYQIQADGPQSLVTAEDLGERKEVMAAGSKVAVDIPLATRSGKGNFRVIVSYTYCRTGQSTGVCRLKRVAWVVPVSVAATGAKAVNLQVQ